MTHKGFLKSSTFCHFFQTLLNFEKKKKKMYVNIKRESANMLWTTYFPFLPSSTEQLLSLGSMAHCLCPC